MGVSRDTLFRGRILNSDEWTEGSLLRRVIKDGTGRTTAYICPEVTASYFDGTAITYGPFYEVDPATIGQFTGLTDRNDKRIFEGDVVEGLDFNAEDGYAVIKWDEDTARFVIAGNGLTVDFDNYYSYEVEVISNRWDTPELLEGGLE